MRKISLCLALAVPLMFANACGEKGALPTDAYQLTNATRNATTCVSYTQTRALAVTLFGETGNGSVPSKLDGVQTKLDAGKLPEARTLGLNLIRFITNDAREKKMTGTSAQLTQLVNQILCMISLPGTVGSVLDAFVVIPGDPQDTVVNTEGSAGVVLPANVVSEPTIITIEPIPFTQTAPGTGPLNTKLDQYPGYFFFTKISATNAPLLLPVTVAVCPAASVPVSIRSRLRLGHDAVTGFELTPSANADFLVCPVEGTALREGSGTTQGATLLARTASISLLGATGGVGGTTGTFSPFGTVDYNLTATGGVGGTTGTFIKMGGQAITAMFNGRPMAAATSSCFESALGSPVAAECRPTVTIKTLLGTILENVPVSFAVTQGGGTTAADAAGTCGAFSSTAVVTTNNFGAAIACWTLGPAAGPNTIVATPSTGGDVPATAVFSPATITFNVTGVLIDVTPPVIADPVVTGAEGRNGWYTSDVSVTWQVSDPETSFTSTGCTAALTSNSAGTTFTCSATNAVGLSSSRSITIKRDNVVPEVSANVSGTKGTEDWYISTVSVTWSVSASGPSGLGGKTGCVDATVNVDGNFSFDCSAESGAGLTSAVVSAAGKRDATPPVVTYSGNLGSYGVDQTISIACSATDATSGILSHSCAPVQGPAYAFNVGSNTRSASALDHAGNVGSGSTSFTVVLTTANLCSLTRIFSTSASVAGSMCTKLENAQRATARGDLKARAGMINAFMEEVKAQTGKALTAAQAQVLTRLAQQL